MLKQEGVLSPLLGGDLTSLNAHELLKINEDIGSKRRASLMGCRWPLAYACWVLLAAVLHAYTTITGSSHKTRNTYDTSEDSRVTEMIKAFPTTRNPCL